MSHNLMKGYQEQRDMDSSPTEWERRMVYSRESVIPVYVTRVILGLGMASSYPWLYGVIIVILFFIGSLFVRIPVQSVVLGVQWVMLVAYMAALSVLMIYQEDDYLLLLVLAVEWLMTGVGVLLYRRYVGRLQAGEVKILI